jgi:2-iminobutanoate/2-iminopropanoate deaminase
MTQRQLRSDRETLATCLPEQERSDLVRKEIFLEELAPPVSHYTHAVRFGNLLFISGIGPTDVNGVVVESSDIRRQTEQVLTNMQTVLHAAGASFADILKVTVYLTDIDDRAAVDEVRRRFFGEHRPASTLIEVSKFVHSDTGMAIEIEAIAGLD